MKILLTLLTLELNREDAVIVLEVEGEAALAVVPV